MIEPDILEWVAQAREGDRRAVARLITQVERDRSMAARIVPALFQATGQAHVVGITGPPGSGKSTLVNELAKAFRRRPRQDGGPAPQVGIVAVDPTSPFTGGALLGDRVRMRDLAGDDGIFIRSMASRGSLGGLARATGDVIRILDAAGFDLILVETVGAGQAEVDIASTAHTTLVIEAPGMGDDIQSIKAGILEIADILVLNKADRPGKESTLKALKLMLNLNPLGTRQQPPSANGEPGDDGRWRTPLRETVALTGEGIEPLVDTILEHRAYLEQSGQWARREEDRIRQEVNRLLQLRFMDQLELAVSGSEREQVIKDVARRLLDPYTAVAQLYARLPALRKN